VNSRRFPSKSRGLSPGGEKVGRGFSTFGARPRIGATISPVTTTLNSTDFPVSFVSATNWAIIGIWFGADENFSQEYTPLPAPIFRISPCDSWLWSQPWFGFGLSYVAKALSRPSANRFRSGEILKVGSPGRGTFGGER